MTVEELMTFLAKHPSDMEVGIEVYDEARDLRLWGPLTLADIECDEVNLFGRHDPEPCAAYPQMQGRAGT